MITNEVVSEKNKRFGQWLNHCRTEQNVTLEMLGSGICSPGMINFLERGLKNSGKQLRGRLLGRLGISDDEYETYLGLDEYDEWSLQQTICRRLLEGEVQEAAEDIEKYKMYCGMEEMPEADKDLYRLSKQFYLEMKGILYRLQGAEPGLLADIYREAVMLTIPEVTEKAMENVVLSIRELNLILEASYWSRISGRHEAVTDGANLVLQYLASHIIEDKLRAKIFPKVVYYYCREIVSDKWKECMDEEQQCDRYAHALFLCNEAIELLRKTERTYYLWELLQVGEQLGKCPEGEAASEVWSCNHLEEVHQKVFGQIALFRKWKQTVEQWYEELEIPKEQTSEIYLYVEQNVFCINDVIRKRRKMLGMSRQELCDNICSLDTLRRLENQQKTTQVGIVRDLCKRLHLPEEYERTELVTADLEAHSLEKAICKELNNYNFEESLKLMEKLERRLDMSEPINLQWMEAQKSIALHYLGRIGDEEYQAKLLEALGYTVSPSVISSVQSTEYYLTNFEMCCIYHISLMKKTSDSEEAFRRAKPIYMLNKRYEEENTARNHIGPYELCMNHVGRLLYDIQRYDEMKEVNTRTARTCLSIGRAFCAESIMYNLLCWKTETACNEGCSNDEWEKGLILCHNISVFFKNEVFADFFEGLLKQAQSNHDESYPER